MAASENRSQTISAIEVKSLFNTIRERAAGMERYLVAIAGPPGSGKSTLAEAIVEMFPATEAALIPMDGFHYDNAILTQLALRERKGAPETFDYEGFAALLKRIRANEAIIAIPVFDRPADLARAGAALISSEVKFIVVEGNYLLLDEPPWSALADCFDFAVFLNVARDELQRRLRQRWLDLDYSTERAESWIANNDMPNVDRILARRRAADLVLTSG